MIDIMFARSRCELQDFSCKLLMIGLLMIISSHMWRFVYVGSSCNIMIVAIRRNIINLSFVLFNLTSMFFTNVFVFVSFLLLQDCG